VLLKPSASAKPNAIPAVIGFFIAFPSNWSLGAAPLGRALVCVAGTWTHGGMHRFVDFTNQ
jgi:hypothetical protein